MKAAHRTWNPPDDTTPRDVVLVVCADEAYHRDVNSFATEIAGQPALRQIAPYPERAAPN
jgi:hypothetical protein